MNRRWAGEQLDRLGIINALHVYRDARLQGLKEPDQAAIAVACAQALRYFGQESEDRAMRQSVPPISRLMHDTLMSET